MAAPPTSLPNASRNVDGRLAFAFFGCVLFVYIRTLASGLLLGDSGEFQVLAKTGGLAHGTGYPIYILIAKMFTLLPVGADTWRVNFLSALMGAIAVTEVFLIARALKVRRAYALIVAGVLAINPIFWLQSIVAEIYTISDAAFGAILLFLLLWRTRREAKLLAFAGLLGGLCWGMHHLIVLCFPAVLLYLFVNRARKLEWMVAMGATFVGFASSMAAYIAMASIHNQTTAINSIRPSASAFGLKISDFDTLRTRIDFIMNARQFGDTFAGTSITRLADNIALYGKTVQPQLGWPIVLAALAGLWFLISLKAHRKEATLLVGSAVMLYTFTAFYIADDAYVEYLPGLMLLMVFASLGLQGIQDKWFANWTNSSFRWRSALGVAGSVVIGILFVVGGAFNAIRSGIPDFLDGHDRAVPYPIEIPTEPYDMAVTFISSIPDNSFVLSDWTHEYPSYYVALEQHKYRIEIPETTPVGTTGNRPAASFVAYLKEQMKTRPVYTWVRFLHMDEFKFTHVGPDLFRVTLRDPNDKEPIIKPNAR